jgi:predicted RNA-binding Zn ribbon-like protein
MTATRPAFPSYALRGPQLVGGALCLDFLNTVEWRGDPARTFERFTGYAELAHWSRSAGTIAGGTADALLVAAAHYPGAADRVLAEALALRDDLVQLFGDPSAPAPMTRLNCLLDRLPEIGRLANAHGRAVWSPVGSLDLRLPLLAPAVSAAALLVSATRGHIKHCTDARCGWLFVDESPRGSRLWCSMASCGNRAKARAHYARRRRKAAAA